jgi:hypothetical protein
MKRTSLLLLSTTTVYRGCRVLLPEAIKNLHTPKCITCKNFIPDSFDSPTFSKCKKFGKANLVSGEIAYDFADSCRETESKCGTIGTHYIFDEFHKAKNDMRKLKPFLTGGLILSPVILILFATIYNRHH